MPGKHTPKIPATDTERKRAEKSTQVSIAQPISDQVFIHKTSFFLKTHAGFALAKFQISIQLLTFLLDGMVQGVEVNKNRKLIDSDKDREIAYKLAQLAK